MTNTALAELLSYTLEHAGPASNRLNDFVAAYFDNTDPDELLARGPVTLFAMANAHWRLLDAPRTPKTARIRVFNPTLSEDGFVSDHTVVQIVNDNMPFLVDSVTMAINRGNRTAHWIVHPLLSVERDAQGKVLHVRSAAAAGAAGHADPVESLIQVECDRIVGAAEHPAPPCPPAAAKRAWNFCVGWKTATSPSSARGTMTCGATAMQSAWWPSPKPAWGFCAAPHRPPRPVCPLKRWRCWNPTNWCWSPRP